MKKYFLFVLVVVLAVALVFIYNISSKEARVEKNSGVEIKTEKPYKEKPVAPPEESDAEELNKNSLTSSKKTKMEQIYEKNEWLRKNGFEYMFNADGSNHHLKDPLSDYDVYSLDTLTAMADSDPKAALELGDRLLKKHEYDKARKHLYSSAVHGYAKGLTDLSKSYIKEGKKLLDNNSESLEADKLFIDGYAWGQVMNLRFYPNKSEPEIGGKIYVNDERLQLIKNRARERAVELYQELQSDRSAKGLGEFDNYIPDSFKQ